jgi:hypothetical protein
MDGAPGYAEYSLCTNRENAAKYKRQTQDSTRICLFDSDLGGTRLTRFVRGGTPHYGLMGLASLIGFNSFYNT